MVLCQFHPRLQFQCRKPQSPRPILGLIDQLTRQTLAPVARRDSQFSQIQRPGLRRQEHAADRRADDPDLADLRLAGQIPGRQVAQRGWRVYAPLHIAESLVEQCQDCGPNGGIGNKAGCHAAKVRPVPADCKRAVGSPFQVG